MKIEYIEKNFSINSRARIMQANEIIAESEAEGYESMTLRQIYYQFVQKNLIANNLQEYKKLQALLSDARLAGWIDWDSMEDRTREFNGFYYPGLTSAESVLYGAGHGHEVDYWENQEIYPEVWVEKEALLGVLEKPCQKLRVPYYACKGNNSQSEQHKAALRFIEKIDEGKECVLFYLGDHDPTGIDIPRDNLDRLSMFIGKDSDASKFKLIRLALNMEQIQKFKLPPNPAKKTDSRWKKYAKKYGDKSWELDALKSKHIGELIEKNIHTVIDADKWKESQDKESAEKETYFAAARLLENPPEPPEPEPCQSCAKREALAKLKRKNAKTKPRK